MSERYNDTQSRNDDILSLQNKPQRQTERKKVLPLLFIGFAMILIVGGAITTWLVLTRQSNPATIGGGSAPTTQPTKSGTGDPPIYYTTVKQYVAQKLRLSVAEITVRLQEGRTASLTNIASQQGITPAQLRTILIDAEQKGHDVLVQNGALTQPMSDQGMQDIKTWNLDRLDQHTKYYFLDN